MATGNVILAQTSMSLFLPSLHIHLSSLTLTFFLVRHYTQSLEALAAHIDHPQLPAFVRRFLFDQTNDV